MAAYQDFRNPYMNHSANNRLLAASSVGDLVTIRELTVDAPHPAAAAAPLYRGEGGSSPIHLAAGENQLETVRFLIEQVGVPIDYGDAHGATALHYACSMKCLETIDYLLTTTRSTSGAPANVNAVDDSGETPLHDACSRGEGNGNALAAVRRLLQVPGITVNHMSSQARMRPLDLCLLHERNDMAALFLQHAGGTACPPREYLHAAAQHGTAGAVRFLLRAGADCTYQGDYGCTALDFATGIKDDALRVPMVRLLLEAGSDPTAVNRRQWTPLHTVCKDGRDVDVLRCMVVEFGANPNCVATRDAATPLHIVCALGGSGSGGGNGNGNNYNYNNDGDSNRWIMMELLLANGADINARDERGRTPLHRACANNSSVAARALLQHRQYGVADLNAVDAKGQTPFGMARKAARWDLMEVFLASGRLDARLLGPDRHGRTLLHHACYKGRLGAVQSLLRNYNDAAVGVDYLQARTASGLTPIQVAAVYKRRNVVFFLLHERNNQLIPHYPPQAQQQE